MDRRVDAATFDTWASSYDEDVFAGAGFPFEGYADVVRAVVSAVVAVAPARVLELGIGTGNVARAVSDLSPASELWGIDFSPQMLAQAAEKLPSARLVQADLDDLAALELPRFDVVLAVYVLHEFTDDRKLDLLGHLFEQRLQPAGEVVVGDVAFPTVEARDEARRAEAARWDPDEHYFAADEFLLGLEGCGIIGRYEQISGCGGCFVLRRPADRGVWRTRPGVLGVRSCNGSNLPNSRQIDSRFVRMQDLTPDLRARGRPRCSATRSTATSRSGTRARRRPPARPNLI